MCDDHFISFHLSFFTVGAGGGVVVGGNPVHDYEYTHEYEYE